VTLANLAKGHLLWNAAQVITSYIEEKADHLVKGKTVLELGAGAGLPSIACAIHGASKVVVTDYPDPDLVANLRYNIDHCGLTKSKGDITAEGYLWGSPVDVLQRHIGPGSKDFDVLILADILFNHSEHVKLMKTLQAAMKSGPDSVALVFFTPYRPWLLDKDLRFFDLAQEHGFTVTKIVEHTMDKVMFDKDAGDELLRRTVFGYEVKWKV
jgi:EEF1A N-terminal glycine/lysine methyltransferase